MTLVVLHFEYVDVFDHSGELEGDINFVEGNTIFGKEPYDDITIDLVRLELNRFRILFPYQYHNKLLEGDDFNLDEIKEEFKQKEDEGLPDIVFQNIGLPEGRAYCLQPGKPITIIYCYDSRYNYFNWLSELHPSKYDRGLLKLELKKIEF